MVIVGLRGDGILAVGGRPRAINLAITNPYLGGFRPECIWDTGALARFSRLRYNAGFAPYMGRTVEVNG
jgi:hypothetical protein